MKITRTNPIKENFHSQKKIPKKSKEFSSNFQFFSDQERKQHLKKLLNKIEKKGQHIISTHSIRTVEEYKLMIQEYLSFILQSGYHIKKIQNPWNGMSMNIVEILDNELEELSALVLEEQKNAIAIINKVDSISGILLDSYK